MGYYEQPDDDYSPLWMRAKSMRTKESIDSAVDAYNKRRDKKTWTKPANAAVQGYRKPFAKKDDGRKIGFRR
jgi:hypothetical protein